MTLLGIYVLKTRFYHWTKGQDLLFSLTVFPNMRKYIAGAKVHEKQWTSHEYNYSRHLIAQAMPGFE